MAGFAGVLLLGFVTCVLGANKITTVQDTTNLTMMKTVCAGAPVSNLNMCNNTCQACSASSSYKCSACNEQFALSNDACHLDNNIHNFTIYNYLNALTAELMIADVRQFVYGDTGTALSANKILEICKENTYELFMAGPFKENNSVGINYKFVDKIDEIQIKFNFMALVQDITLIIDINDENVFRKKFTIFSDLVGTYGKNPSNEEPNHLFLQALSTNNVGSVISPVDTGPISIISNDIRIRVSTISSSSGYNWGFNDFVVIQRACETCVTEAVQQLMDRMGVLCGVVAAVVVALLVLLFVMIKLEVLQRKWEFDAKLGSSNSLPTKAIDRIIDTLQRSCKTIQKEFKREDKRFLKLTKREL